MKKIIKFIMIFSISIILVLSFSSITGFAASADNSFTGYSAGLSEEQLEKATTKTYFGDVNYPLENYTYDSITNNLDESSPLLTVLVHGYGSNASIWSNNFEFLSDNEVGDESIDVNFTYDPNSLIERLRKISNANVYYGTMTSINEFELYRITDLSDNYSDAKEFYEENGYITTELLNSIDYIQNGEVVKQISDISKHSIVIFESNGPWDSNKDEYDRLNTMIDKIVYDIKILNQNKLPKINLISHSRGGLTVMQYVLNHPHLVNDVFTIGAPYLGSKLGNSDLLLGIIGGNDPGTNDILDPNLYTAYQERWNDNYESLYSDINYNVIGSYCSLEFISYMAINDSYYVLDWLNLLIALLNEVKIVENSIIGIADLIAGFTDDSDVSKAVLAITDSIKIEKFKDFFTGRLIIEDDLLMTNNGSYILSNGIIVLVDEDIDGYLTGSLIFYNPRDNEELLQ